MQLLKLAAVGTLGFIAYKAWQRRRPTTTPGTAQDDGSVTPPHGDPVLVGAGIDVDMPVRPAAQSSRGFGGV
ncbi:hypothetical protein [Xanthomonas sp. XNM01]|uniref:hypothetical protein n=1 Tax=Xanthomonas sp. XNM01 TaxID=2769289 RepID=UPI0017876FBD|nr:hypothetical protein [Xanthomonas sp. XNM01]MBD9370132.1 hypothetical protein [Xanthomonas sp. XNM01]